ncbi:GCN5 family acetyltransferase [Comamonas aquatica]|uniref:GNAT family N-acetyltransferase n=1 Tax=Comamonas aquatica TaxID=225991 RepID=UPI0005ED35C0|nr:GNAT family N-acetyltransferase [Comamonas aquatica]ANY61273.1 GCN5 family acetyltransferase [Comamonas aquatica]
MSAACTLRAAQPDDAPALATLLQGIGWFDRFATGHPEAHADQLAPLLAPSPHQLQLVACDAQGQLIGYCAVHWLPIAILQGWEGYVSELFIADSARGLGVGSQLLDQVTTAARSRGCRRLWLVNNRQRDSYHRGFYARQGWQEQTQAARFVLDL